MRRGSTLLFMALVMVLYSMPIVLKAQAVCGEPKEEDFTRTTVLGGLDEPLEMEFTPDGRILLIEKVTGKLLIHKPATGQTVLAALFDVSTSGNHADGLLGLELDPGFASNHWLYLYYSPVDKVVNRISRFVLNGDKLDLASEKVLLEIPTQRNHCCHSAGGLEFGPGGNLYVSVGDNSKVTSGVLNPEAEATSGNTNDLRGKILRIHPEPNGSYTIPLGNLFPTGMAKTKAEIFTMGHRNPFRFSVDAATGWVLSGDVGPDGDDDFDEFNVTDKAANFGWPYFVGPEAYSVNGILADPKAPVNKSPSNTGLETLPAMRPPSLAYAYRGTTRFPAFDRGGRVACAGPIYHYDPTSNSKIKLPPWFDKKWLIWDWKQRWIRAVTLDGQGNFLAVSDLFPKLIAKDSISRLSSMKIGPDGALYLLQYGWLAYSPSTTGALMRMEYKNMACLTSSLKTLKPRRTSDPHDLPVFGKAGRFLDMRGRVLKPK
jgi:cytochrome c